jgi:hypothetical protein
MINDHNVLEKRLAWKSDYEVTEIEQSNDLFTHFAIFLYCDTITSKNAIKEINWQKIMMMKLISFKKTTCGKWWSFQNDKRLLDWCSRQG